MEKTFQIDSVFVTQENIDDILVGALEGGITYWCSKVRVVGIKYLGEYASEQISRGGKLDFYAFESAFDNDITCYRLTLDKLLKGIARFYKENKNDIMFVNDGDRVTVDCCNADAPRCDCIIQYALFNEIVFG